jgi:hypothetical protein
MYSRFGSPSLVQARHQNIRCAGLHFSEYLSMVVAAVASVIEGCLSAVASRSLFADILPGPVRRGCHDKHTALEAISASLRDVTSLHDFIAARRKSSA